MEQQINPYESGQAVQQGYADPSASLPVTPVALAALVGTKFWVSLVGIVMLVVVALGVIAMLSQGFDFPMDGMSGVFTVLIIVQLAMLVIQIILAVRLIQYAKAIGRLSRSNDNADLERAMEVQSKYWKLFGIMCIIMIALMLVTMIASVMMLNSAFRAL